MSSVRDTHYQRIKVKPFFNEDSSEALLLQVEWFQREFKVTDYFFLDMLNVENTEFSEWKYRSGFLSTNKQNLLREFWQMLLHFMSFYDYDIALLREVFQYDGEAVPTRSRHDPPWTSTGGSLRNYLEKGGPPSIREVNHWIQSLRYANWY